jgi:hypothetical protein
MLGQRLKLGVGNNIWKALVSIMQNEKTVIHKQLPGQQGPVLGQVPYGGDASYGGA